jgi:hypothetical protein
MLSTDVEGCIERYICRNRLSITAGVLMELLALHGAVAN